MGRRVPIDKTSSLLELAQLNGVGIEATCGGKGRCGACKVRINNRASKLQAPESSVLGSDVDEGYRLACQVHVKEGGSVWVPESSRLHRQVILTTGYKHKMHFDPEISLWELTVPYGKSEKTDDLRERILEELGQTSGLGENFPWRIPSALLHGLEKITSSASGRLSLVTTASGRCLDISPGWNKDCLGLAVDLGTTTIVAYLIDLKTGQVLSVEACMNPQVSYGEDVISRISLCWNGSGSLEELGRVVHQSINRLVHDACGNAGVDPMRIFEALVVGNTAMHHIYLGLNPYCLAQAPFTPVKSDSLEVSARSVALDVAPGAQVNMLPVKAGFVGADTVAAALALDADHVSAPTLILDLGTNGEIVLATPHKMLCCSCAAGPAFEGGHIKWGLRGAPGAVDHVSVSADSLAPTVRVIGGGPALGICGSGLLSLVSELVKVGAVTASGGFDSTRRCKYLRQGPDGWEYLVVMQDKTDTGQDLVLTHQDLSQLQLAKAAIHAGIRILMGELGVTRLEKVLLAGAFGNYLDPLAACGINMFPGVTKDIVTGVGNAAGAGAITAIISRSQRKRAQALARRMAYLELAAHPKFNETFIESMSFVG